MLRPVLTQDLSLSPLSHATRAAQREQETRAAARHRLKGNPARGSTFMSYTVDPLRLASSTRRSRERSHVPEDHTLCTPDAPSRRTTCPRGPSVGTLPRRLCGFPGCKRLGRARLRRVVHACCTARGGELCESCYGARATMARCRVEWPYGAHGESLREACGSGRRCPPRPPPGKPSTIRYSPDLVPSVRPSGAALGGRCDLRSTCY